MHIVYAKLGQASAGDSDAKLFMKHAPEGARTHICNEECMTNIEYFFDWNDRALVTSRGRENIQNK